MDRMNRIKKAKFMFFCLLRVIYGVTGLAAPKKYDFGGLNLL